MYKKLLQISLLGSLLILSGCRQAQFERAVTWANYKVEMYSGGELVREWISSGMVTSDSNDMTSYFKDKETGKLIEVSGDIVITEL